MGMYASKSIPKVGRPLKGSQKRIRVSFTLSPDQLEWLKREARTLNISRSEFLDRLFNAKTKAMHGMRAGFPRIYVPQKKIEVFCLKRRVESFAFFGSVLRQDFSPNSDIDILVDFKKDHAPTLFDIVAMEKELKEIFDGRTVDLKTQYDLNKHFRNLVLKEALVIYEAPKK